VDPWPHFQHKQKQVCPQHPSSITGLGTVPPSLSPAPNTKKNINIQNCVECKKECKDPVTPSNHSSHKMTGGYPSIKATSMQILNSSVTDKTTILICLVITNQAKNIKM